VLPPPPALPLSAAAMLPFALPFAPQHHHHHHQLSLPSLGTTTTTMMMMEEDFFLLVRLRTKRKRSKYILLVNTYQ
jgi:hypothetical protein